MKHSAEYNTFTNAVEHLMAVPKAEILRREAAYKRQTDLNPHKRGTGVLGSHAAAVRLSGERRHQWRKRDGVGVRDCRQRLLWRGLQSATGREPVRGERGNARPGCADGVDGGFEPR